MKPWRMLPALLAAAWLAAGCAYSTVQTTVNADGSWKRHVELRATHSEQKPGEISLTPDVKLSDLFVLPQGTAWTVRKTRDGGEDVITVERAARTGEELSGDITLRTDSKKGAAGPLVIDRVAVRELAPNRWEYRETLHYTGARSADIAIPKDLGPLSSAEFRQWVRAGLPARLATPQNEARFGNQFALAFVQELFGPPDPLLDQILLSPGAAQFRLNTRMSPIVVRSLDETFGSQITPAERLQVARAMVTQAQKTMTSFREKQQAGGPPGAGGKTDEGSPPVFLSFSVGMPGRIVDTNGIRDDVTGTVSWGLYSWSPVVRDVELRAVFERG